MSDIIERIEREAGVPGLASILAERLAPTDLQSLLLEVYRRRSQRLSPAAVLTSYETNRFVRPSAVPPGRFARWEQVALGHLPPGVEVLALSPVCPLGSCSVMAGVDQNWAVSTARNTEVVSDATNVLALECAVRRRDLLRSDPRSAVAVQLACSHRLLRGQHFHGPRQMAHFNAFLICSAGRDTGAVQFEVAALAMHARFYARALRAYLGPSVPLYLSVTDFAAADRADLIEARLLAPIRGEFENVSCTIDPGRESGRGYYVGLCFKMHAGLPSGERMELIDGGAVPWAQRLLSNARERLIISGIGSERLCQEFGPHEQRD